MKIGFDAKRAFKNNTGLGNYSRMIIRALADQQTQLFLFTPDTKGGYSTFYGNRSNVTVVTPTGLWRLFPSLWRSFGIAQKIRQLHLDVYHGLSHELPRGSVGKTRLVVSMHDLIVWRYPKHFPLVDRLIYKQKQRHACRHADTIVAISGQTERDLIDIMGVDAERIKVVYQSCDPIFRQQISTEQRLSARKRYSLPDKYIICIGTIEKRKNQAAVVEALKELDGNAADLHLVFIGRKTPYYDTVAETVKKHALESRVHFLQGVDFADFPALYSEAIASVYMSIFEGFGIPILESLSCGTPVVASSRSSIPEVGGEAALYADPDNPSDIASQILKILTNSNLYEKLRMQSIKQAANFDPNKIASELVSLYESK